MDKVNRLKLSERERDNLIESKSEAEIIVKEELEIRKLNNLIYQLLQAASIQEQDAMREKFTQLSDRLKQERERHVEDRREAEKRQVEYEQQVTIYEAVEAELIKSTKVETVTGVEGRG